MKKLFTLVGILFLSMGFVFADQYFEGATDGTLDQEWDFNTVTFDSGDTLKIVDSTASGWGSHVMVFEDAAYTGLLHLKDVVLSDYTIEADIFVSGAIDANYPLYYGLGFCMAY